MEATHAQLENLTYQMSTMSKKQANDVLAGPIALMKAQTTKTFEYCAREAAQIFGGASYVRGGQGEKVERLYREARARAAGERSALPHRGGPCTAPGRCVARARWPATAESATTAAAVGARVRHSRRQRGDHAGPRGEAGDEGD